MARKDKKTGKGTGQAGGPTVPPSASSHVAPTQEEAIEVAEAKDVGPASAPKVPTNSTTMPQSTAHDSTAGAVPPPTNPATSSGSPHERGLIARLFLSPSDTIFAALLLGVSVWLVSTTVQHGRLLTELRADADSQNKLAALRLGYVEKRLDATGTNVDNGMAAIGRLETQLKVSNSQIESLNKRLDELPEIRATLTKQASTIDKLQGRNGARQ